MVENLLKKVNPIVLKSLFVQYLFGGGSLIRSGRSDPMGGKGTKCFRMEQVRIEPGFLYKLFRTNFFVSILAATVFLFSDVSFFISFFISIFMPDTKLEV